MNDAIVGRRISPLDVDECLRLLGTQPLGRIAFMAGAEPVILPMNYVLHEGSVILRTTYGTVLDALAGGADVAFEVDHIDRDYHEGWSVVVRGMTEEVTEPRDLAAVRELPLRPWAPGERDHYVRILSTAITGRRIE